MSQHHNSKYRKSPTHISSGHTPVFFIPDGLDTAIHKTYCNVLTELLAAADRLEGQLRSFYSKKPTYDWLSSAGDTLLSDALGIVPIAALKNQNIFVITEHINTQSANYSSNSYEQVDALLHSPHKGDDSKAFTLTDYVPKNEIDRLLPLTYHRTTLTKQQIAERLDNAAYDQKEHLLLASYTELSHLSDSLIDQLGEYTFECLAEYHLLDVLQHAGIGRFFQVQALSPYYGYVVPKLVDEAQLGHEYQNSFDKSMQLYQLLWDGGYHSEAQSALLSGHIIRWSMSIDLSGVSRLFALSNSHMRGTSGTFIADIQKCITSVHPLINQALQKNTM